MCCSTRHSHWPKLMRLALAALICGILAPMVLADDPQTPADRGKPAGIPQAVYEQDPDSGLYHLYVILPNGEKQLLKTLPPSVQNQARNNPALRDYLHAVNALAAGERYVIGVELKTIPEGLHARLGIDENCGLVVAQLVPEKPAEAAGVQQHDLLLKVNGQPVSLPGDVVRLVNEAKASPITLTLIRDAEPFDLQVTPVEIARSEGLGVQETPPGPGPAAGTSAGSLPPGVQIVGPGIIRSTAKGADLELLHADMASMQEQLKRLTEEVQELQEQLQKK
ncbi:PDZ domain-containing protein [Planctomicrobium sp. SH661]|uniref:PDZ domain-containing protein n=1 Tax=Planctomicrobium sp. SH661 TaxID=3448124 RepID=UPI003F5C3D21